MKMEPAHKTLTLTVPNGVLKKHHNHHHQQQQTALYRECLKNHAASLGGHSLDGCGEFMASPSSNPSDPTSLTCAACGCHRNFHRRFHHHHHSPPPSQPHQQHQNQQQQPRQQHQPALDDGDHEDEDEDEDEDDVGTDHGETSSAPRMLMALSAAVGTTAAAAQGQDQHNHQQQGSRKRFRTKFSAEQKEGMLELSERLGWRMQKRDEGLVEERCREIGVGRGVFKVWMHNNKHNFVPSPRPATATAATAVPTASDGADGGGGIISGTNVRVNGPGSAMDTCYSLDSRVLPSAP